MKTFLEFVLSLELKVLFFHPSYFKVIYKLLSLCHFQLLNDRI